MLFPHHNLSSIRNNKAVKAPLPCCCLMLLWRSMPWAHRSKSRTGNPANPHAHAPQKTPPGNPAQKRVPSHTAQHEQRPPRALKSCDRALPPNFPANGGRRFQQSKGGGPVPPLLPDWGAPGGPGHRGKAPFLPHPIRNCPVSPVYRPCHIMRHVQLRRTHACCPRMPAAAASVPSAASLFLLCLSADISPS